MSKIKRTRRAKPRNPTEIARLAYERRQKEKDPANWGVDGTALALSANRDIKIDEPGQGKVTRIQRYDCFALLHSRKALGVDDENDQRLAAIRRLEQDMAVRLRLSGAVGDLVVVDSSGPKDGFSRQALDAGDRIDEVLDQIGPLFARLLAALLEPSVLRGAPVNNWRKVVQEITGEITEHGQTAMVRAACQVLFDAWTAHDYRTRKDAA